MEQNGIVIMSDEIWKSWQYQGETQTEWVMQVFDVAIVLHSPTTKLHCETFG